MSQLFTNFQTQVKIFTFLPKNTITRNSPKPCQTSQPSFNRYFLKVSAEQKFFLIFAKELKYEDVSLVPHFPYCLINFGLTLVCSTLINNDVNLLTFCVESKLLIGNIVLCEITKPIVSLLSFWLSCTKLVFLSKNNFPLNRVCMG